MSDKYMDEATQEFLVDGFEELEQVNQDLVGLEQDSSDPEVIARIFRTMHTIKGTGGCLGFDKLKELTHAGENLLTLLRDGKLSVNQDNISALLELNDAVREMMTCIEQTGKEGDDDYLAVKLRLIELQQRASTTSPTQIERGEDVFDALRAGEVAIQAAAPPEPTEAELNSQRRAKLATLLAERVPPKIGELLVDAGYVAQEAVDKAIAQQQRGDPRHLGEILVEGGMIEPGVVREVLNVQDARKAKIAGSNLSTIRVSVSQLDKLMNLVGELVLTRNQLGEYVSRTDDHICMGISQRLNHITAELQEDVMKTRLQPLGSVWGKFPRVVRDLALACGKNVRLEILGSETELDRSLIEAIRDPMTHLVRNAVDHGIEKPDTRQQRGKPVEGLLKVRASHAGGQVDIEIVDDGGGIDADIIRRKAISKGLITAEQAAHLSEKASLELIFLPGFSTAETVSEISGRGVGMDVVKTNIERVGGTVEIQTRVGYGTTFKLKIPLTLAIVPALMVTAGGERFAIPQASLIELVRINTAVNGGQGIEFIHGTPVFRLRGRMLSVVDLADALGLRAPDEHGWLNRNRDATLNLIVLQTEGKSFGLVVDEVSDTQEIVVKSMSRQVQHIPVFAGATILGDGRIALILDVQGVAKYAHALSTMDALAMPMQQPSEPAPPSNEKHQMLLVCHGPDGGRLAVPLSDVARLDKIPRWRVEKTGDCEVIQYRGHIMPLIYLPGALPERRQAPRDRELATVPRLREDDGTIQVVIYKHSGRKAGLVVDYIDDIVEDRGVVRGDASREFVSYTAVIDGYVTEVVDIEAVIRQRVPTFFDAAQKNLG